MEYGEVRSLSARSCKIEVIDIDKLAIKMMFG